MLTFASPLSAPHAHDDLLEIDDVCGKRCKSHDVARDRFGIVEREASEMLQGLIDSIVLIPDDGQLRIELRGNLPQR
jgi:hypothetical protein